MSGTLLDHPRWHPEPLGLLVTRHDIHWTLLIHPYCGWLRGRQTFHHEKTQSIKRTWLKYIYLVWSLSYQQWSNSLCDVRFVLTNGCLRPGAMGSDNACQIEVAIALSRGGLHSLAQRSWQRLCVLPAGFSSCRFLSFLFPFSLFLCTSPTSSFSFIFLSFVLLYPILPSFLVSPICVI